MKKHQQYSPPLQPTLQSNNNRLHALPDLSKERLPEFYPRTYPTERIQLYSPPETWYPPRSSESIRFVEEAPGVGYLHPASISEIRDTLQKIPARILEELAPLLDVVKLSRRTRKNAAQNLYGLQWGGAVYLYPFTDSLQEYYVRPPLNEERIQTERYGGKWTAIGNGACCLTWTKETLRDFYLHEVLMHEIGHILDKRNTSYQARERFANAFATNYGYLPWKLQRPVRSVCRQHHSKSRG